MDYIYQGEVMIFQEQLDEFLEVAQKLKIVGLNSDTNHEQVKEENNLESQNNHFIDRHSYNYENQFTNDLMKEDNILLAPVMNSSTQIKKLRYPDMDKTTGCPTKNVTLFWRAVAPLNFELGIKVGGVLESSGSQL